MDYISQLLDGIDIDGIMAFITDLLAKPNLQELLDKLIALITELIAK